MAEIDPRRLKIDCCRELPTAIDCCRREGVRRREEEDLPGRSPRMKRRFPGGRLADQLGTAGRRHTESRTMFWEKFDRDEGMRIPIKSWCREVEPEAMRQAVNLSRHPKTAGHVALMPDCHVGYGMPIGGVIACANAVIPNAVGVDIGCGMVAVQTTLPAAALGSKVVIRGILDAVKARIPVGEGCGHRSEQAWDGFDLMLDTLGGKTPAWLSEDRLRHDKRNLGTLGGGNHFIELQAAGDGALWLMIHSGSRNLGYRIAEFHHGRAQELCAAHGIDLPHKDLAYLAADSAEGRAYIRDMTFALDYAKENRRRMMAAVKEAVAARFPNVEFLPEVGIHHNFAALETHGGSAVWVHRKGATSAQEGEIGIIPGSMGTASYIVRGRGSAESFASCSHGAGRRMGRMDACRRLSPEACDQAMGEVVFDRWNRLKGHRGKKSPGLFDLAEAPLAYKDIDEVMAAETDLAVPLVRLKPLGVVKG